MGERRTTQRDRGSRLTGYLFVSPALVGLVVFVLVPMSYALGLSFFRWDLIRPNARFIGLDNYAETLTAPAFWNALRVTAVYTLGTVPLSMALGLGLATLLNRRLPGRDLLRTVAFLPSVTSIIAVSVVWAWLLHPDFGLLNAALNAVGIGSRRWLSSSTDALPALMLVSVWRRVGHDMVIYLAGLQGIAVEYVEAAAVDGATGGSGSGTSSGPCSRRSRCSSRWWRS